MLYNLLNKLFGYRWSLYVATEDKVLCYVMHSDCVYSLLLRVANFFIERGDPREPWKLYLNFNKKHKEVLLSKNDFQKGIGVGIKKELLEQIRELDPKYENYIGSRNKPVFKDLINNIYLKISPLDFKNLSSMNMSDLLSSQREKTAMEILSDIFNN